jgi:hypothetical protein
VGHDPEGAAVTPRIVLELSTAEAVHLGGLLRQFLDLLGDTGAATGDDPALARLAPDAYPDDQEASREFRSLTRGDLLARRRDDAQRLLAQLATVVDLETDAASLRADDELAIPLDPDALQAWLRTLAALRLVIAARLGIDDEEDQDFSDPRFGIYEWLGYRLDGLVRAADGD